MYLKLLRDEIIEGLQKSANIIPAKTGAAFLRTIWLKAENGSVRVMSTDSNLEFCGEYPAEIIEEGLAGVQGRSFYDLVRKLPSGQITLRTTDGGEAGQTLHLEQAGRKYKLPVSDPTWFQNLSAFPAGDSVFWSGDFLQELIDKVAFCISDEDTMEAIACMNLKPVAGKDGDKDAKAIEACGLNGHQFSMVSFLNDDLYKLLPEAGVLIQKKYIAELKKWLTSDEIELAMGDKRLFFRTGDKKETFSLPLSYYQYPDYHSFLARVSGGGAGNAVLDVSRPEMVDALERISIFNTDNNRCTYFSFPTAGAPGETVLHSQGQDTGTATESIESVFAGELPRIAFPTRNLIEILSHFGSDKVRFTLSGSEGPCGITGESDPEYLVVIMPMKIVEETYYSEEEA